MTFVIYQNPAPMFRNIFERQIPDRQQQKVVPIDGLPPWLESMETWMKYLFIGVAGMSLVAYGFMVYTQEQWRISHQQLQKLKTQERQLAITNARIKNQMAEDAQREQSGLMPPQPADFLYVPANTYAVPATVKPAPLAQPIPLPGPVGY